MSDYIKRDKALKELHLNHKDVIYIDKRDTAKRIEKIQGIDLADYVPKDFHDKTCEAMAERHTEEMQRLMSKRGEWIRTGRTNIYGGIEVQCSNCGDKVMVQHLEDEWYCRHCGADMGMKGADDEI